MNRLHTKIFTALVLLHFGCSPNQDSHLKNGEATSEETPSEELLDDSMPVVANSPPEIAEIVDLRHLENIEERLSERKLGPLSLGTLFFDNKEVIQLINGTKSITVPCASISKLNNQGNVELTIDTPETTFLEAVEMADLLLDLIGLRKRLRKWSESHSEQELREMNFYQGIRIEDKRYSVKVYNNLQYAKPWCVSLIVEFTE